MRTSPIPRSTFRCGRTDTVHMTISLASRNGRRPAAWGSKNGSRSPSDSRCRPCHAGARVRSCVVRIRLRQCRFRQDPCAGAARDPAAAQWRAAGKNPLHHLYQSRRRQHGGTGVFHARPLDHARRCCARCGDPRSRRDPPRSELADARPRIVRLRAGNAGRAEGADHPRAVHPAAAAVPVRGQRAGALRRARRPRPERDDGARQSRGAARCLPRSRQRDGPCAQYRDGQRRRRHLQGRGARGLPEPRPLHGLDRRGRQRRCRGGADVGDAWRRSRRSVEDVEREIVDGPHLPRSRWEEVAAVLDTGSNADRKQAARLRERVDRSSGRHRSTNISASSSPMPARRDKRW